MNEWVWSNGGMVLTGENWSAGRETLYSVGGRWMNGYGALVEWYWQGKTEVLGEKHRVGGRWMNGCGAMVEWYWQAKTKVLEEKHYIVWVVGEWMGMDHWWNGSDRGNLKYWENSVGGRWMNGYGGMVEWYWQWKTEVLGQTHYIELVVGEWMGMEHWWNGTDRQKLKYWERNII